MRQQPLRVSYSIPVIISPGIIQRTLVEAGKTDRPYRMECEACGCAEYIMADVPGPRNDPLVFAYYHSACSSVLSPQVRDEVEAMAPGAEREYSLL